MVSCGIRKPFGFLSPRQGQIAHALLTRPPLEHAQITLPVSPLDLHVLGTPPAFVLSQDQTLMLILSAQKLSLALLLALKFLDCVAFFLLLLCIFFKVRALKRAYLE